MGFWDLWQAKRADLVGMGRQTGLSIHLASGQFLLSKAKEAEVKSLGLKVRERLSSNGTS